jgi:hypothetical protein
LKGIDGQGRVAEATESSYTYVSLYILIVRQDAYWGRVSIFSKWGERSGVGALVEWKRVEDDEWKLEAIVEEGVKCEPTAEMIISFILEVWSS